MCRAAVVGVCSRRAARRRAVATTTVATTMAVWTATVLRRRLRSRLFTPDANDSIPTPPSQKALSSIVNHGRWLELIDAAHEFDRTAADTKISHREATRVVSASQFGAGMWLEACPDAYKKTGVTLPTAKKTLRKLARGPVSVFLMAEYDGKW